MNADTSPALVSITGRAVSEPAPSRNHPRNFVLPLTIETADGVHHAVDDRTPFRKGDVARLAILEERREEAEAWLVQEGWEELAAPMP